MSDASPPALWRRCVRQAARRLDLDTWEEGPVFTGSRLLELQVSSTSGGTSSTYSVLGGAPGAVPRPSRETTGVLAFNAPIPPARSAWVIERADGATPQGGLHVAAAVGYAEIPAATVAAAVAAATPSPIPVALAPPLSSGSLPVDWRGSAWATLVPELGPGAASFSHASLAVLVAPGGLGVPGYALLSMSPPSNVDVDAGTVPFGRGLPARWREYRAVFFHASAALAATAVSEAATYDLHAQRLEPLASATGPIVPRISAARAPRIAGRDAREPQANVGATPVLSWTVPVVGAATFYEVWIVRVPATSTTPPVIWMSRAILSTTDTSIRIPPALLEAGNAYVAVIRATRDLAWSAEAPFRPSTDYEYVEAVTAPFTP